MVGQDERLLARHTRLRTITNVIVRIAQWTALVN
jgi:hypothetical protein